ncbi:melanopsin-A [Chanos chanos]|uniref:Melanopsin-A n=1 Tax=Chanos chanos TaxID=29144 RepID=A0A6J2V7G0_CHACN|nr:melanopsin-A-like [Chanos chanos]
MVSSALHSVRKGISCPIQDPNCTRIVETLSSWNSTVVNAYRLVDLPPVATSVTSVTMSQEVLHPFPTVDVPDHAHYTIGAVILAIGITGMVGNFLVIYAFSRSQTLRTPANMFIINLAITDFLMCLTQAPIFFTTSMHKRWIFGEKGCELYAFCGALFGICSMITLMVIAVDRYFVITRPLASIGVLSCKRALLILLAAWAYSLGWSLPPFFGWSAYVPEGLLTSCTWDYMTFTPSVRAYTMLLFTFVFFIPLIVIIYCYFFIFRAIRSTNKAVGKINGNNSRDSLKRFHRLKNEWKMAKIALIVILLYVISWSPYSTVALTAFAGYADMLTPYMNSVPAVIAKASAIHNPIIYAITHPKYRSAIAKYIPCLGVLLCVPQRELHSLHSSFTSTRRSTVTSQNSDVSGHFRRTSTGKSRLSSASDSESGWTDTEADVSSMGSRPASRQVSCDVSKDTAEQLDFKPCSSSSFKSKLRSHDSGIFEKTSSDVDDSSMAGGGHPDRSLPPAGDIVDGAVSRGIIGRIPSIVITSESSPFLPSLRSSCRNARSWLSHGNMGVGSVSRDMNGDVQQGSAHLSTANTCVDPTNNEKSLPQPGSQGSDQAGVSDTARPKRKRREDPQLPKAGGTAVCVNERQP